MLKGKTVLLGVSGSIAAYKAAELCSALKKQHADVHVLLTRNAAQFIGPVTFETLTGNKCLTDCFDRDFRFEVEHVSLAKRADLLLAAPASADLLAKLACGLADDMLTTTALACTCPRLIAPAMNTKMWENQIVRDNVARLERYGWELIPPASGRLACGDEGAGKLPEPKVLLEHILLHLAYRKDLAGKKVLVTAGPTQEALDPVRYLTNRSSGKMGYALARNAARRGASVTLVSGPVSLEPPLSVRLLPVVTAEEMYEAVIREAPAHDIILKAAAVADYRFARTSGEKLKKGDGPLCLELERNPDILAYLGAQRRPGQFLCGFSMETEDLVGRSRAKLEKKHLDMVAANSLRTPGAGFQGDTNAVTILTRDRQVDLPLLSKDETAARILDQILLSLKEGDAS